MMNITWKYTKRCMINAVINKVVFVLYTYKKIEFNLKGYILVQMGSVNSIEMINATETQPIPDNMMIHLISSTLIPRSEQNRIDGQDIIKVELPGATADGIMLKYIGNNIYLRAAKKDGIKNASGIDLYGIYRAKITIDTGYCIDDISWDFSCGVLTITIPRVPELHTSQTMHFRFKIKLDATSFPSLLERAHRLGLTNVTHTIKSAAPQEAEIEASGRFDSAEVFARDPSVITWKTLATALENTTWQPLNYIVDEVWGDTRNHPELSRVG
jgi:HSP20 family molecular chaperone IbpA